MRGLRSTAAVLRTTRARRLLNIVSVGGALVFTVLAGKHFASVGLPFRRADPAMLAVAGLLFLAAFALKAHGWRRLIAGDERPHTSSLAAATGAAAVGGAALPGRFDDVLRVAVVRRCPGPRPAVGTLCVSLALLGLVDAAALVPFAGGAAATAHTSTGMRAGLALVAVAGTAAAAIVLSLPSLAGNARVQRFGPARWLCTHVAPPREAGASLLLVAGSWLLRAVATFLVLAALGGPHSLPLAVGFLCAGAASAALPIAPAGAATQAGAGAAMLAASGMATSDAIAFAVAAQALVLLAGAAVVLAAAAWSASARVLERRAAPAAA